jgi:hypothetical protein
MCLKLNVEQISPNTATVREITTGSVAVQNFSIGATNL